MANRALISWSTLSSILCVFAGSAFAGTPVFDQSDTGPANGGYSIGGCTMGQTFVPALTRIELVDLECVNTTVGMTNDESPVQLAVAVHLGDPTGPLIGLSDTVTVSGLQTRGVRFVFPSIPLTPSQVYSFAFLQVSGTAVWGVGMTAYNSYPGGVLFVCAPGADYGIDAWFREGVFDGSPTRPESWGRIKATYR